MKLELVIPTSLNEIPLLHYQKFISIAKNNTDEEFISQKMIEIFCGISLKDVVKFKATDVIDLVNHFNKIFSDKGKLKRTFKMQNIEFGFIPDLENISLAEYSDLDKYIVDFDNIHKAMAVMYRPIKNKRGEQYEIEDYNGTANYSELMKYAPLDVVLPASVFFWTLGAELLEATLNYLENVAKKSKKILTSLASKHNFPSNGDGLHQFINLQKEMLQRLTTLQNKDYLSV
jgi:hypothetical protein